MTEGNQHKDVIDRISGLPGNVIDTIFSCLPLRDAARTSILSRKWRHNFLNTPKLDFSVSLLQESIRNQPSAGKTLVSVIDQVLLLHRGRITEFKLCLPQVKSYSDIDRFMSYLSMNAVEKLHLSILGNEIYKLPLSLYSCLQLKNLILEYCIFKPPTSFRGFSRLTCLVFGSVTFDSEEFGSFVSKCVLLESLTVINYEVPYQSITIDAPKLRYLHLEGRLNPICFKRAPRLEILEIVPNGDLEAYRIKLKEREVPNFKLEILEIFPNGNGEAYGIKLKEGEVSNFKLLKRLPMIKHMRINYLFLKSLAGGKVPMKHLNISIPLKVLELTDICFVRLEDVSCALELIRSSTNLRKIVIQMLCTREPVTDAITWPALEYLEAQDYSEMKLDQLREVKIERVKGVKAEREFIKLLLATSPILEVILVELRYLPDKELIMMLKDLVQFERASQ